MFSKKTLAILKIRAKLLQAARFWLDQNGYVEMHGPTIVPAVGDWPGYFEVKYFDKKAYLTQGLQPYSNAFLAHLNKIYTIAPVFRAEKVKTNRHLAEYWRIEVAQNCDLETIIGVQEELVAHIIGSLATEATEEFGYFEREIGDLLKVKKPFPRLTYDEVIDIFQKDGLNVSWGQRLDWELEAKLSRKFDRPFFITKFPMGVDTLFFESDPQRPELTLSFDLFAPEGYGEMGSGAQMTTKKRTLLRKMQTENIDPADRQWYMSFIHECSGSHSGFMMGVERIIQSICRIDHISDAVAFPRIIDNIYP